MSRGADEDLISAEQVSKKFCKSATNSLWYGARDLLREVAGLRASLPGVLREAEFFAVKDISFQLSRGESLAVMGHNGAGKTTLLKLLIGRLKPTSGRIVTRGNFAVVTELGLGFDPALSGRENVYVGGAVLGLTREQVDSRLAQIIDFAEVEQFIDSPVKTFSTGMRARLGYAIVAHLNPDVLLVDEALAVGDIGFRRKCIHHVRNFLGQGGSLMWASHDPYLVQSVCKRCIVLERGQLIFDGSAVEGVERYLRASVRRPEGGSARLTTGRASEGITAARKASPEVPLPATGGEGENGTGSEVGHVSRTPSTAPIAEGEISRRRVASSAAPGISLHKRRGLPGPAPMVDPLCHGPTRSLSLRAFM